jgi:predicted Zn finger-like uncharacterized protein
MIVTCEKCDTSFELDDSLIKESGSEVKCSECEHVFTVWKPGAAVEPEAVTEPPADSPSTEEDLAADIFDAEDLGLEDASEEPIPEFEDVAVEEPSEASMETAEEEVVEEDLDLGDITEGIEGPAEEIDVEGIGEAPEEVAEAEPVEEELDLDGIGEALEGTTEAGPVEEELDLDGIGEALEEPAEAGPMEELDLGDIGEVSEEAEAEEPFDEELDLESISRAVEEAADAPDLVSEDVKDEILEFDLIDGEEAAPEQEVTFEEIGAEEEVVAEEIVQEEVEIPEETAPVFEEEEEAVEIGAVEAEEEEIEEEVPPVPEEILAPPSSAMKGAGGKKRISAPIMILLILALLGGGAYGGYMYLQSTGTKIPYLQPYIDSLLGTPETAVVEPGNLRITVVEQDVNTRFIENAVAGNLFIIEGKVRNDYPAARSFIMIRGALYASDGTAVRQSSVFCGNTFTDSELQTADKAAIEQTLRNKFGDQRSNFQVGAGQVLPFMVVFSDLPQDFGEYSVQVVSSSAGQ